MEMRTAAEMERRKRLRKRGGSGGGTGQREWRERWRTIRDDKTEKWRKKEMSEEMDESMTRTAEVVREEKTRRKSSTATRRLSTFEQIVFGWKLPGGDHRTAHLPCHP